MGDLITWTLGVVPGSFIGFHAGRWWHQRRLEAIARNMPRDSVALATLRRLEENTRHVARDRSA